MFIDTLLKAALFVVVCSHHCLGVDGLLHRGALLLSRGACTIAREGSFPRSVLFLHCFRGVLAPLLGRGGGAFRRCFGLCLKGTFRAS